MKPGNVVLVTGGAGFLGSHLCEKLLVMGMKVICLDNLLTSSKINIKYLMDIPEFHFVYHDIINPIEITCDYIFNLACPASPMQYYNRPIETLKACTVGVLNMLDLATRKGAFFLQASTSEVYGDPLVHPQVESYWGNVNPIGHRSCYDEGKRVAESMVTNYHKQDLIQGRIARIFNTYGPRLDIGDGRIVSNFIVNALNNSPLEIYGDPNKTRSFCYVDDTVEGLIAVMTKFNLAPEPTNIGNPHEITLKELAETIIKLTGSKSTIEFTDGGLVNGADDPKVRKPDISKAKKLLEWEPKVSLEEGLTKTITYFQRKLSGIERITDILRNFPW